MTRPAPRSSPATYLAVAVGVLALWSIVYVLGLSGLSTGRQQQKMYGDLRSNLAQEITPIGGQITPGTPLGLIEVPRISLRSVFVEGTSGGDLEKGPGHLRSSPLPGQAGVSEIFGRALAFGGPFAHITALRPGDLIRATTQQGSFLYKVTGVRRAGDALPDPPASGVGELTLVSAVGVSWRAGWVPDQAVYVDATLQSATEPTPAGRPTAVPVAELPMRGDSGARFPLVLWLQVLLFAAVGVAWATARWGGPQAWLVGAPAILAILWGGSQVAIQLLPNLM